MNGIQAATRLHLTKKNMTFGVPVQIVGLVAVISALIALIIWRAGGTPGSAEWITGARSNGGMAFGLLGFLVYLGVQSIATTFPFALTLGSTRKAFVGGTLVWAAVTSAYLAVIYAVLLLVELATDHWFASVYIFDVYYLGTGDLLILLPTVFLGSLSALTIGALFGASWARFGNRGPVFLGAGLAIGLLGLLALVLPSITGSVLDGFRLWWLAVAAVVIIAVSAVMTLLLLRSAVVR
ncbi:hypothetical protein FQ377_03810 [Arthrobacter echini]|uniref:Uncharacterized protein n=1 Tax=Arthrobacter echini TaxID=1529066 RepID=A0A5D0XUL8_9MICC|nr:hypothetical protein [Arthrobacter echini]TYD00565.1 hypothetical protein FQ377_03810 [Arthrobacter echini]